MRKVLLSLLIATTLLTGGCVSKTVEEVPTATTEITTISLAGASAQEEAYISVLSMSKMLKDAYEYHNPISYDEFYNEADKVVANLEIYKNEFDGKDILFKDNHRDLYNCIVFLYDECFLQFDDMNNKLDAENLKVMEKSIVDNMEKINRLLESVSK